MRVLLQDGGESKRSGQVSAVGPLTRRLSGNAMTATQLHGFSSCFEATVLISYRDGQSVQMVSCIQMCVSNWLN